MRDCPGLILVITFGVLVGVLWPAKRASPATAGTRNGVRLYAVGHTTSSNYPVTNGSVYVRDGPTGQNGSLSVLSLGGGSTTLGFSTYLGGGSGGSGTQIRDLWVDNSGNIYVGGTTSDRDLPTRRGVFQSGYAGGPDDAFIAKYSSAGALLWVSYLGSAGPQIEEKVYGIAGYDPQGNLTVCGRMNPASGYAGTPATKIGPVSGGTTHAFAAKVKPDGSGIVWITLLGGSSGDGNRGRCVLDGEGNVYGEGETQSTDFPITQGGFQRRSRSAQRKSAQGFVYKLNARGALVWSTYVGGSGGVGGGDAATGGIALDASGNVFFSDYTYSADLGATPGAYQNKFPSSRGSTCYIGKLKGDGTAMLALTYLGGSTPFHDASPRFAECMGLNLDASGNVVVLGLTPYKDFPTTPGAYQAKFPGGNYCGFVSKLSPDLSTLLHSTFIGGSGNEAGDSSARIEFDSSGNVWTALTTTSTDFPVTPDAYQSAYQGGKHDEVIVGFSPDLRKLIYSTYVGGNGDDYNRSFRLK